MTTKLRRILLILAASSGVTAITALTAEAGRELNHCEPRIRPQERPGVDADSAAEQVES